MEITLCKYTGRAIDVNKQLETYGTFQGYLRETTTLLKPDFMIHSGTFYQLLNTVNYLYVPIFGRYYFMGNPELIRNDLWRIPARVDVLKSHKEQLLLQSGIVARQENRWNLFLNDGQFRAYQNSSFSTLTFPQGFSGQSFILSVMGGPSS